MSQLRNGLLRDQMRPLVEPFRHQQFGAGAHRRALAFDFDLDAHEHLRCRVDDHRAEAERLYEINRTFKNPDVAHGNIWRHGDLSQSSALWVKKWFRIRCTSSVKTGSAIASSERGRGSGTSSSAPNGSSISMILGSCTSARQIDARCCMPPDNCHGSFFSKPSSPTSFKSSIARGRYSERGSRFMSIGSMTLARMLRHGSSSEFWNTMPTLPCGFVTASPSTKISPVEGAKSPEIIFKSVDLPQPDGPTTTKNSPALI